jgi:hypothetical protein
MRQRRPGANCKLGRRPLTNSSWPGDSRLMSLQLHSHNPWTSDSTLPGPEHRINVPGPEPVIFLHSGTAGACCV